MSGHIAAVMHILYAHMSILLRCNHRFLVMFVFILCSSFFSFICPPSSYLFYFIFLELLQESQSNLVLLGGWASCSLKVPPNPSMILSQLLSCRRQGLQNDPLKKKHWAGLLALNRWLKGPSWKTFKYSKRY